jgi:hypothetical protein
MKQETFAIQIANLMPLASLFLDERDEALLDPCAV